MATKRSKMSLGSMAVNSENKGQVKDNGYRKIRLEDLDDNPHNARTFYSPDKIQSKMDSLQEKGLISPVIVVPGADSNSNKPYVVIDGHYRYKSAKALGWTEIDALVREDISLSEYFKYSRDANDIHESNTPFDIARGVLRLKESGLATNNSDLALLAGETSEVTVTKLLKINEIPEAVAEILANRDPKIELSVAYEIYLLWKALLKADADNAMTEFSEYCQVVVCDKKAGRNEIERYRKSVEAQGRKTTKKTEKPPFQEFFNEKKQRLGKIDLRGKQVKLAFKATTPEQAIKIAEAIKNILGNEGGYK